ncbi:MAG: radical SAM protein [Chloroflexia bacterium]
MNALEDLLGQAWQVRQSRFPPSLGADDPRNTRAISLTGSGCALNCAHCGRHYLEAMLPIAGLSPQDPSLDGASSLLISGGCDREGRVPFTAHLEEVRALRPGRRLNWHVGLIGEKEAAALAGLADIISFDLVGDDDTIAEVYGLKATVEDYRRTYRLLRRSLPVVPHITIGLRGGRISGERAALRLLQEEGAEAIVFLVLIPTPGTRYAHCTPPPLREVAGLLAEARLAFPTIPLLLGCMRPGGAYRRALDSLAVRAGINRIVKPHPAALELAARLGLQVEAGRECCALALIPHPYPPAPLPLSHWERGRGDRGEGVRVSAGTEAVLGLRRLPMEAAPTTAYFLLDGGGCAMACAFCAQARDSRARADALSRVVWPTHPLEDILAALRRAPPEMERICLQVTLHRGAKERVREILQTLRTATSLPVSAAIRPRDLEELEELFSWGVDTVGLGLDCAGERVYRQVKGAGWASMRRLVEEGCRRFPGRVRVHLMVGLGETEEECCRTMQEVYDWGGAVSLFAFTPVRGTRLEGHPPPPLGTYRRMQVARYLLERGLARFEQFRFSEGRLLSFGRPDLPALLADGQAFRTSGCPGCNRPFYNERPGGTMYNYPRPLSPQEIVQAVQELDLLTEEDSDAPFSVPHLPSGPAAGPGR